MIEIKVNGIKRHMAIEVTQVLDGEVPHWYVTIDGHLGRGGTFDAAAAAAARAASINGRLKEPT